MVLVNVFSTEIVKSYVNLDLNEVNNSSESSLPIICFRQGSPPIPDVHNISVTGLGKTCKWSSTRKTYHCTYLTIPLSGLSLQNVAEFYPMQKNVLFGVTNEQINRGSPYSFRGNVSGDVCSTSMMWGQFCNQEVNMPCIKNNSLTGIGMDSELYRTMREDVIACTNADGIVCHEDEGPKIYSLDAMTVVEELYISVANVTFDGTKPSNITRAHASACYARY